MFGTIVPTDPGEVGCTGLPCYPRRQVYVVESGQGIKSFSRSPTRQRLEQKQTRGRLRDIEHSTETRCRLEYIDKVSWSCGKAEGPEGAWDPSPFRGSLELNGREGGRTQGSVGGFPSPEIFHAAILEPRTKNWVNIGALAMEHADFDTYT